MSASPQAQLMATSCVREHWPRFVACGPQIAPIAAGPVGARLPEAKEAVVRALAAMWPGRGAPVWPMSAGSGGTRGRTALAGTSPVSRP